MTDIQTKVLLANATDKIPEFTVIISAIYTNFLKYRNNVYAVEEMLSNINTHVLGIWIKLWAWAENYVVRC